MISDYSVTESKSARIIGTSQRIGVQVKLSLLNSGVETASAGIGGVSRVFPVLAFVCLLVCGCMEAAPPTGPRKLPTTDKIGEFDPNAANEIVKPDARVTDPVTGPIAVLNAVRIQLPTLAIDHALNLFNATEGNYPRSHEEFMTRIIAENNIRLPQMSADLEYQYDVANHKLLIVRTADGKIAE